MCRNQRQKHGPKQTPDNQCNNVKLNPTYHNKDSIVSTKIVGH